MAMTLPPPGSDEAIRRGCQCPVMDNAGGRGYMGQDGVYAIAGGCPLHDVGRYENMRRGSE